MVQLSALYRGWCNYYRFANAPQRAFNKLARYLWWAYAYFLARKQKSSIAAVIAREKKAKRLIEIQKDNRKRQTFQIPLTEKTVMLDIFPLRTQTIQALTNRRNWEIDLKPIRPMGWQSGRSLATRLAALDRAKGVCERC